MSFAITLNFGASDCYDGFNAVLSAPVGPDSQNQAFFVTNYRFNSSQTSLTGVNDSSVKERMEALPNDQCLVKRIEPGLHSFSNSTLDDMEWPKVDYMKNSLKETLYKSMLNDNTEAAIKCTQCSRKSIGADDLNEICFAHWLLTTIDPIW